MVAGAQLTAEHNVATTRSFYPVGSRLGVFGNISAGFRLLPTCWAALMADPTLLLVPLAVLFVGGVPRLATSRRSAASPTCSPAATEPLL